MTRIDTAPTREEDIPALLAVLDQTGLFPGDMLADMIGPALSGEAPDIWLSGRIDGEVVGFAYTAPEAFAENVWNMYALAVRPDHQGGGLGAALVAATEERLRRAGQRLLLVETSGADAFERTRSFYARIGFAQEARIRDYWSEGDDKVIFRKAL